MSALPTCSLMARPWRNSALAKLTSWGILVRDCGFKFIDSLSICAHRDWSYALFAAGVELDTSEEANVEVAESMLDSYKKEPS